MRELSKLARRQNGVRRNDRQPNMSGPMACRGPQHVSYCVARHESSFVGEDKEHCQHGTLLSQPINCGQHQIVHAVDIYLEFFVSSLDDLQQRLRIYAFVVKITWFCVVLTVQLFFFCFVPLGLLRSNR